MLKTLALTSYNHKLYEDYAHRFLDTYQGELDLAIASEDQLPTLDRVLTLKMTAHKNFVKMNAWRRPKGYKQDAVRFCYKPYAIWTAMDSIRNSEDHNYTGLLWIDADSVFHKPITEEFVQERLHTDGVMTYMGRPNYYSETGVLYFNLLNPKTRYYVERVIELYNTNEIYELSETHDSYVWDWVRTRMQTTLRGQPRVSATEFRNIGVDHKVPGGHIQAHLFGEYWDHLKGKRKQKGYSSENAHTPR